VDFFKTLKHLTAPSALKSIFNEGIFGRRTLLNFNLMFKPASLHQSDINQGDGNAICFGSQHIDWKSNHGVELIFDAKKISKNNPSIFYKQRDFGYELEEQSTRAAKIGELELFFSHDKEQRCQEIFHTPFTLYAKRGSSHDTYYAPYAYSSIITDSFIAYDVDKMHEILTLNFFRFIDTLTNASLEPDMDTRNEIYQAFETLDDDALVEALTQVGQAMTDTMEFNFYGAHLIDFSTLLSIKYYADELNLAGFIKALNDGDTHQLDTAVSLFSETKLFGSWRFIDYLLLEVSHPVVTLRLQALREQCTVPDWLNKGMLTNAACDVSDDSASSDDELGGISTVCSIS
jgi:hypothetical protein